MRFNASCQFIEAGKPEGSCPSQRRRDRSIPNGREERSFAGLYVTALSPENGFTVYTVALGAYDLFPVLQQYVGPYPHINQPTSKMVYVDTNTQLVNHGQINPGSLLRFRGLVFDDNGTMRMDCGQIYDGVTEQDFRKRFRAL